MLFLVVAKSQKEDPDLEKEMDGLNIEFATNKHYVRFQISVLQIPHSNEKDLKTYLDGKQYLEIENFREDF